MAAGLKSLVLLAFFGSVGMTLLVIGCATHDNWWPFFVTIFYVLAPVPILLSRRYSSSGMGPSNACQELAIFITMGIVISAFGLPIVLHRAPGPKAEGVITLSALLYVLGGNVVVFSTIVGFFVTFGNEDVEYAMW